jgi:hypothetical protein
VVLTNLEECLAHTKTGTHRQQLLGSPARVRLCSLASEVLMKSFVERGSMSTANNREDMSMNSIFIQCLSLVLLN